MRFDFVFIKTVFILGQELHKLILILKPRIIYSNTILHVLMYIL